MVIFNDIISCILKIFLTYASTENNDIKPLMILIEHIH